MLRVSQDEFQRIYFSYDFQNINDQAKPLIIELREIIEKYSLKLEDIFKKFDKNHSGRSRLCL